jgi:hypothetical protein
MIQCFNKKVGQVLVLQAYASRVATSAAREQHKGSDTISIIHSLSSACYSRSIVDYIAFASTCQGKKLGWL